MTRNKLSMADLRQAYAQNENITKLLIEEGGLSHQEIIEVAYDIQSGSYSQIALANKDREEHNAKEIYELCQEYICDNDLILDCGAGELTTLSAFSHHLPEKSRLMACDISLSRLLVGRRFSEQCMRSDHALAIELFVADMACMPLADCSVDVVFTSHSLEPNHGREYAILSELLRIARRHLILFEPSWEHASAAVKSRMQEHGYVRELPHHIEAAGGRLISVNPLPTPSSLMNPTYCYIVEASNQGSFEYNSEKHFRCPRSGYPLKKRSNYWWSKEGGWAYPEIEGISCLRTNHGVLMSHG